MDEHHLHHHLTNNGPDQVTGAVVQDTATTARALQAMLSPSRAMACRAAASPSAICRPRVLPLVR